MSDDAMTRVRMHRPWDRTYQRYLLPDHEVDPSIREARRNGATLHLDSDECSWCERAEATTMSDLDASPVRLPDPPEWMVDEALAWGDQ